MRMTGTEKSFKTWAETKTDVAIFWYQNTTNEGRGEFRVRVPEIGMDWRGDAIGANEARILAVENFEKKKTFYNLSELFEGDYDLVDGKFQYGDLAHAKKRAVAIGRRPLTWNKSKNNNVWHGYTSDPGSHAVFIIKKVGNNPVKKSRRKKNPVTKLHWIANAYWHTNDQNFNLGYFDGTRAQAIKYFNAKKNVNRYFRPGYTVTIRANPIILHDGYETNPKLRQKGNTRVTEHGGKELTVTLYSTDIVKILPNGDIELNTGGHKTPTTKRRMNEAADELELYFNVYAKKGNWYVDTTGRNAANQTYEFFDGIVIPGPGHLKNPKSRKKNPATHNRERFLLMVKEIQKFGTDELFAFAAKHQRGRGAMNLGFYGDGSRVLVGDLSNFAANLGAAKTTSGDTKKMYQRIAHDILTDATKTEYKMRKKNPVGAVKPRGYIIATFIRVYNSIGYALDSNGARMDFRKTNAKVWKTKNGADRAAQKVADGWGDPVAVFPVNTSAKQIESLIGKDIKKVKTRRRRNPVGPTQREIDQAGDLFKDFTGNAPDNLQKVRIRNPKTGLVIGELDGVLYTTIRDGKTEKYKHDFKKGNRPHLVASHDGQSLHILGGDYEFTERGIEG